MSVKPPCCPQCGKPLRKIITELSFGPGEELDTIEQVRAKTNGRVISVRRAAAVRYLTEEEQKEFDAKWGQTRGPRIKNMTMRDETRGQVIHRAAVWDGSSYRGPFCTLRCAADYGHAAYRSRRP